MNYPRANYRVVDATELALAAIYEALNINGQAGWNAWFAAAANGEWI